MLLEDAKVLSHERLTESYSFLRLEAPGVAGEAAPGQFVHLRVPALEPSALRRPFSICGAEPRDGLLGILYKRVGRGTRAMESLRPGDTANLMGPLGKAFPMPLDGEAPALIAGGFGVAPLLFLAKKITEAAAVGALRPGAAPALFVGGRSAEDILLLDEFRKIGIRCMVCTDDGSLGEKGFVAVALDKWLDAEAGGGAQNAGRVKPRFYCCGPEPLLRAVDERAQKRGLPAWLSLDRRMACAVGACLACVVRVKTPGGGEPTLLRACKDGPVFAEGTIVW